jgi:hypothetical protein
VSAVPVLRICYHHKFPDSPLRRCSVNAQVEVLERYGTIHARLPVASRDAASSSTFKGSDLQFARGTLSYSFSEALLTNDGAIKVASLQPTAKHTGSMQMMPTEHLRKRHVKSYIPYPLVNMQIQTMETILYTGKHFHLSKHTS